MRAGMGNPCVFVGVVVIIGTAMAGRECRTFRVACLESTGHTLFKDSDKKIDVLCAGLSLQLEQQLKAETPVDLIVTGEFPTFMGSEDGMENMAQAIPGPRSEKLASVAARYRVWLVADMLEKVPTAGGYDVYNTLIVFDRQGRLVASHRKVQLSPGEIDRGIKAGAELTVIDTEFGVIVPIICWEARYPDHVARMMAAAADRGLRPHLVVHPSAGYFENQLPEIARNHNVYVASACWDKYSRIIAPDGEVLDQQCNRAKIPEEMTLAVADIPVGPKQSCTSLSAPTTAPASE